MAINKQIQTRRFEAAKAPASVYASQEMIPRRSCKLLHTIPHAIFLQSAAYIARCSIYIINAYTVTCMVTYWRTLLHSRSLHCYGHPTRADYCTTQTTSCKHCSIVRHLHYMRQRHVDALSPLLLLHPKHRAGNLTQTCKHTKAQETRNQNLQPT